ncbi:MAG: hypothetical protein QM572_05845, partial [Nocardioides sp.]|uniref:hypothetical protein n=1 Tax=Nocardioides sp. TaxID=35761 RepID=UPI0039E3FC13
MRTTGGAVALAGISVAVGLVLAPRVGVLALLGAGAAVVGSAMVARRRSAREAEATAARLIDACEQLAAELAAGQAPAVGLGRVA